MKSIVIVFAITSFAILGMGRSPGSAHAQCTAYCDVPIDAAYSLFSTPGVAQVVTPPSSGILHHVSLVLANGVGPGDLVVEIRSTTGGVPDAAVLATASLSGVNAQGWYDVDFTTASFMINAGTSYAIVPLAVGGPNNLTWFGDSSSGCRGNNGAGAGYEDLDYDTVWTLISVDFMFELCLGTDDSDGDGVVDAEDNCPYTFNPFQEEYDADGYGDACDNCPQVPNPGQEDADNNGIGDACEVVASPAINWGVLKGSFR